MASIVDPAPDIKSAVTLPSSADRPEAHYAGMQAARDMPFDWYCPRRAGRVPRRECVECTAEVALDAAMAFLFGDDEASR